MFHLLVSFVLIQLHQFSGILYLLIEVLHLVDNILSPILLPVATMNIPQHCTYQMLFSRIRDTIDVLVLTI